MIRLKEKHSKRGVQAFFVVIIFVPSSLYPPANAMVESNDCFYERTL
ncbi:hypothetical protein [Enterococcus durans]|nr:hypothetical protein [Enterococcus durans]